MPGAEVHMKARFAIDPLYHNDSKMNVAAALKTDCDITDTEESEYDEDGPYVEHSDRSDDETDLDHAYHDERIDDAHTTHQRRKMQEQKKEGAERERDFVQMIHEILTDLSGSGNSTTARGMVAEYRSRHNVMISMYLARTALAKLTCCLFIGKGATSRYEHQASCHGESRNDRPTEHHVALLHPKRSLRT
jgi:hypothetical protein